MSATTIKLDGEILKELQSIKPAGETLTGLVRDLLGAEIRRRKMARAATEYAAFIEAHPDEAAEMESWSEAPLERASRRKPRSRSR